MARKTIRRNGRYITIDTKTGKEIKPGTAAWKLAGSLYKGAKQLPAKAKRLVKEAGDTLIYSDKVDSKGRPQTIQQERIRRETKNTNRKTAQTSPNGKTGVFKGPGGNPNRSPAPKVTPKKDTPKAESPKQAAPKVTPKKVTPKATTPKKPAAPKPTAKAKTSADNMRDWALANEEMINKVGTKTQKAILKKALKPKEPKKKKSSALAIGGYS